MKDVTVVVADDEPIVRLGLKAAIAAEAGFVLLGEARNGREAIEMTRRLQPDVLMIDVHMPVVDGFDVLAALGPLAVPVVIFVTAHDEYAVRAFDVNAVDYLLKPFDTERAQLALHRARAKLQLAERAGPAHGDHILVKHEDRVHVVPLSTIEWLEAYGNYIRVHAGRRVLQMRGTLTEFAGRLAERGFVRIHRSALVNVAHISHLEPLPSGESTVILDSGERLQLSRTFRDTFRAVLEGKVEKA
jgi:two-component system LytT family response regulator